MGMTIHARRSIPHSRATAQPDLRQRLQCVPQRQVGSEPSEPLWRRVPSLAPGDKRKPSKKHLNVSHIWRVPSGLIVRLESRWITAELTYNVFLANAADARLCMNRLARGLPNLPPYRV